MSKKLVACFSASGRTAGLAKDLANAIAADYYAIEPAVPYTNADLDWMNKKSRSSVEMADKSSRPEIANQDANIADYDVIFVGFPVWWYTCPTIINTFLESYDFSGKKVVLFATSGGSGIDGAIASAKASTASVVDGKLMNGRNSVADLKKWADQY